MVHLTHVVRQYVGQMGDSVSQRVAERCRQADEDQQAPQRHHGHGKATPSEPPALQGHHERVEDHGDESRDDHEQDDVAKPVDQLAGQVGRGHYRDGGQDGA